MENPWQPPEEWRIETATLVLFVNANAILFWVCADATEVSSKAETRTMTPLRNKDNPGPPALKCSE